MTSKTNKNNSYGDGLTYHIEDLGNSEAAIIAYTAKENDSFLRYATEEKERLKGLVQDLPPSLLYKILQGKQYRSKHILDFVLSLPATNQALLLQMFPDRKRESILKRCEEEKKRRINANLALLKLIGDSEQDQKTPLNSRDDPRSKISSRHHIVLPTKTASMKQPGASHTKMGVVSSEVIPKKEGNTGGKGRRGKSSIDSNDESGKENNQGNHEKGHQESHDDSTDESTTDESSSEEED